ncbi:cysteine hydrolase family protein [Ramlibacter sp.]|uniref:cysteine hydrolase family protein n=1 Tax=Ramlibacter sp. TaxID=1917967 RepID=UPI003D0EE7F3
MSEVLRTLDEQLRPAHTAIVVVDMQNDFCAEGGYLQRTRAAASKNPIDAGANAVIADNIARLVASAREAGCTIAWLRSVYDFKYLADAHIAKRDGEGCCMEGTWGADWFRIAPAAGDVVVTKHTFSGFHDTDLHARLQALGIRTLVMTGVATNVCVDSTLRHGFFLGYNIVVAEDCVGSGNKAGHEGTLATVRVNFGSVVDSTLAMKLLGTR